MAKKIKNFRDGYHANSTYWQDYKKTLPLLSPKAFEIAIGMILGDASIYRKSKEAHIKFEQGYKQEAFIENLFEVFRQYCFMTEFSARYVNKDELKSFWFKTMSHESFTRAFLLFYTDIANNKNCFDVNVYKRKTITPNLILDHLTAVGLAYWIMCDGSLQNDKKSIIIHTQGFTKEENTILSEELNIKFKLHTKVIPHKKKYYVILTHTKDAAILANLITPYMISSMTYKIPCN